MRALAFVLVAAFLLPAFAAPAAAWLPVCKEVHESVRGIVTVHADLDCGKSVWVQVCPPPPSTLPCGRVAVP